MRYERKYIQYNDLVFDGYGMLGEYDASSVSFKVTTHARSFGNGSYAPFKSPNAFVEESSVSLTLWLKEKKLPCDVRPFYRSFVIEQLSKHGKLWAVQDNTLVWAYATVQSYSEMVEHANGKLGIDVDFLLYEGVWHKADKQKTFLHPYDLCTFMDCFDYKEYQPCNGINLTQCCDSIDIAPQTSIGYFEEGIYEPAVINLTDYHDGFESIKIGLEMPVGESVDTVRIGIYFPNGGPYIPFFFDFAAAPNVNSGTFDAITGEVVIDGEVAYVIPQDPEVQYQLVNTFYEAGKLCDWNGAIAIDASINDQRTDVTVTTKGYYREACYGEAPRPDNDRYCCDCDCDQLTADMALCYHLDDLQDVYKECSNAGFRVVYDCEAAERFFNILGQGICTSNCHNGVLAGRIYSETDIPTTGITVTLVGKMHNPYVEINGNGNWIAGDYDGTLRIESNGDVYFENGCKCDEPLPPDVWQKPVGMNYGWTVLPRYNRVIVNLGACCGKACAYFNIDNLTI